MVVGRGEGEGKGETRRPPQEATAARKKRTTTHLDARALPAKDGAGGGLGRLHGGREELGALRLREAAALRGVGLSKAPGSGSGGGGGRRAGL